MVARAGLPGVRGVLFPVLPLEGRPPAGGRPSAANPFTTSSRIGAGSPSTCPGLIDRYGGRVVPARGQSALHPQEWVRRPLLGLRVPLFGDRGRVRHPADPAAENSLRDAADPRADGHPGSCRSLSSRTSCCHGWGATAGSSRGIRCAASRTISLKATMARAATNALTGGPSGSCSRGRCSCTTSSWTSRIIGGWASPSCRRSCSSR